MGLAWSVVRIVIFFFFLALIGRLVIDWVQVLARDWRPRGAVLVIAEGVYSVTDPPLRLLRRFIPALTIGGMRIDFAFLVLMIVTSVLMNVSLA
ncbi:MAG: YggT family protein [Lapillicoccus sp.]